MFLQPIILPILIILYLSISYHFQISVWRFPKDVESSVRELHKEMLKGRREPKSIEDAEDAVRVVERNFKAKVRTGRIGEGKG